MIYIRVAISLVEKCGVVTVYFFLANRVFLVPALKQSEVPLFKDI